MAGEIVTLTFERAPSGAIWTGIFIDVIEPKIKTFTDIVIVPTPADNLPPAATAALLFTPEEIAAFNDGSKLWSNVQLRLTNEQVATPVLAVIAVKNMWTVGNESVPGVAERVQRLRTRYAQVGRRLDSP